MTQQVADTLNAAADLIETRGWVHGAGGWPGHVDASEGGPLCLEGGILAALGLGFEGYDELLRCPAHKAVTEYLALDRDLFGWNDDLAWQHHGNPHPNKTPESHEWAKSRVVEVLRATALIAAAREREAAEVTA